MIQSCQLYAPSPLLLGTYEPFGYKEGERYRVPFTLNPAQHTSIQGHHYIPIQTPSPHTTAGGTVCLGNRALADA